MEDTTTTICPKTDQIMEETETNVKKKRVSKKKMVTKTDFKRNPDGTVNWQGMIPDKFFIPNREWFTNKGREVPASADGLKYYQKLILLAGIKHIAKLRGTTDVSLLVPSAAPDYICVHTKIVWKDMEGEESVSNGLSGVHPYNVDGDIGERYMTEIAENRSYVRAVRSGLNLQSVGNDEVSKSRKKSEKPAAKKVKSNNKPSGDFPTLQDQLAKLIHKAQEHNPATTFEAIKEYFSKDEDGDPDAVNWESTDDVPDNHCFTIMERIINRVKETKGVDLNEE